jgi:hypothetical protein
MLTFRQLVKHEGHDLELIVYGRDEPDEIRLMCFTCNEKVYQVEKEKK